MNEADYSLSVARLADLVKRTLLVMFGRRPVSGTYVFDAPALWQAIWASMIFTLIVMMYPAISNGPMVLFTRLTVQLLAVVLTVLIFIRILNNSGLSNRIFAYLVPFLWVGNVHRLFGGAVENVIIITADLTYSVLLFGLFFWVVYWLWRIGRDQLGRDGWYATGLIFLSIVIDTGLQVFLMSRVQIPVG